MKLIGAVLLFSQLAFAHSTILGKWHSENTLLGRGVEFYLGFEFTETDMAVVVDCRFFDGAHLQASATSNVSYRYNDIIVHETNDNTAKDGYHFCSATLRPSVWTAHIDGYGRTVLYAPVPYQSQFFLSRAY